MPYLNLDDNFADHPKVDRLSHGAFRLHVAGLCYCAKHLTDGAIPADRPPRLISGYRSTYLDELVDQGLWADGGDRYQVHDYLDWNRSREWWEDKRARDAKRKRKWREAREAEEGDQ